jgi:hypothetical protein
VPKRWQPFLRNKEGKVQKAAWECALLTQLNEEIRVGNLEVAYSKRFGHFDDFFIPDAHKHSSAEIHFHQASQILRCIYPSALTQKF